MNLRRMRPDRFLKQIRKGLESRDDRVLGNLAVYRNLISAQTLNQVLDDPQVKTGQCTLEEALQTRGLLRADQVESLYQEKRRQELIDFLQTRTESLPPEVEEAEFDPERNLGRYLLIERIGRGGSAEVWKSWDRQMARWVAIKLLRTEILSPAIITRFQREASLAGQLRHPNIVAVHDTGTWKDRPYIVMDLIEHGDLEKRSLKGQLEIAEVMEKTARAVHMAHEHGIIHRDLKPGNILLDQRGDPLVTDFGLAHSEREVDSITEAGSVLGTPIYMAPEQVLGDEISVRTDVYAMGTILYELITGKRPFEESVLGELFQKITSGPLPPPPRTVKESISPDLENICLKAMARDPLERYSSSVDLAEDLARFRRGQIPHAKPVSLPGRIFRWGKRNPLPTFLSTAIFLLTLFGLTLFWDSQNKQEDRIEALRKAQKAATAYAARNFEAAGQEATEAIRLDPHLSEGHFWAGRIYFRQYRLLRPLPVATIFSDKIRFLSPSRETPEEKALLEKTKRTFAGISQNRLKGNNSWQWDAAQGMVALVEGTYPEAESRLRKAQEETHDREVTYLLALSLYFQQRFQEARTVLQEIPPPREGVVEMARIKIIHALAIESQKKGMPAYALYEEALSLCRKFTQMLPSETRTALEAHIRTTQAVYFYSTGRPLHQRSRLDQLLRQLEALPTRSIETGLMLIKASMVRGQIALREGNPALAKEVYDRGLEILTPLQKSPSPPSILPLLHANILALRAPLQKDPKQKENDIQKALALLERVDLSLQGTSNEILIRATLRSMESPPEEGLRNTIDYLEENERENPANPFLYIAKADHLQELASWEQTQGGNPRPHLRQAYQAIQTALDLSPITHKLFESEIRLASRIFLMGSLPRKGIENHQETLSRIISILSEQEPDSPRISQAKALIHLLETTLLKRRREDATVHYEQAIELLKEHPENPDTLALLAEGWFQFGLARHALGENPTFQFGKALEINRKREELLPDHFLIAIRSREILLSKVNFAPPGEPINWNELEKSLEELSGFLREQPENLPLRMKRANFGYQVALLKNRKGKPFDSLLPLVVEDTTECIQNPRLARKALMLRALIQGMSALQSSTSDQIATALKKLDQSAKDFEQILQKTPNYTQANLYRAEIFFNTLGQNPEGFLRFGGQENVQALLNVIYQDLTCVLAPADNAQAYLLRAQVALLELFLHRQKKGIKGSFEIARRCQEDAKKGSSFNGALSHYLFLAGQFFEWESSEDSISPQRYQELQTQLKQHLEKNPDLSSNQASVLLQLMGSAAEEKK